MTTPLRPSADRCFCGQPTDVNPSEWPAAVVTPYIETPDSEKTEGQVAAQYAIHHPILFLLLQNGAEDKGWRDTPFYWPVIRAQKNTPTAIYTAETSF